MSEEMTPTGEPSVDAKDLVERARSEGAQLVGRGGLLSGLTKTVLETALEVEMEDHLGYPKHAPARLLRHRLRSDITGGAKPAEAQQRAVTPRR